MIDKELLENYKYALSQKYNAICFDIDGTLTLEKSSQIDSRIYPYFANILKHYIPIVFITGRGETGIRELIDEIIPVLKNRYEVNDKHLKRMYALTNDGARLFLSDKNIFDNNLYISSEEEFLRLKNLNSELLYILKEEQLDSYCQITYSKDLQTNKIINIRLMLLADDHNIESKIIAIINKLINRTGSININLSKGHFRGHSILQIGTTIKGNAIKVTERIIGIPENSMLRIGDCGNFEGNDYTMLNCFQGFSVNEVSGAKDSCFPIISNGKIVKGVDATIALLKKVKLIPTMCLQHALEKDYVKKYSEVEQQMNLGKNKRIAHFDEIINKRFNVVDGIYGLFDKNSGSIKIPMYEWNLIDDQNPLKQFWGLQSENQNLLNSLRDNENILLRGSKNYYYFLANRLHDENNDRDILSRQMVQEWLFNYNNFFTYACEAIKKVYFVNSVENLKMLLGILDNARNYLLILINQQINNISNRNNILLNLNLYDENSILYNLFTLLVNVDATMAYITFDLSYQIDKDYVINLIRKVLLISKKFNLSFEKEYVKENYSKDFRVYREIDNFAENFITCYYALQKNLDFNNYSFCGLSYGGIELPMIMKLLNKEFKDIYVLKFNSRIDGYTQKQSFELRYFDISKIGGMILTGINLSRKVILLDDNLLTGKTMQLAITTLYDLGLDVSNVLAVRYPSVNRISQMFLPNHGAVDYRLFFEFIQGLYFPSPYSWRDFCSDNNYTDSLGVFDLNRHKILECLLKNGDYSKNSEVMQLRRQLNK